MEEYYDEEDMRRLQRMREKQERKKKQREQELQELRNRLIKIGIAAGCIVVVAVAAFVFAGRKPREDDSEQMILAKEGQRFFTEARIKKQALKEQDAAGGNGPESAEEPLTYQYTVTENTLQLYGEVSSSHAIFLDAQAGTVLASKDAMSRIVPASMTKVLTLLVAAEHIDNLDDKFTITQEITDYCFLNDCSNAGYAKGETVTIRDLLYATVLPSGADGALGLAYYVSGSQEAFMELMNAKLEELGLSGTAHFTNCVGVYDEDHYCTAYDMAVIMGAALQNELCFEVLSARTYQTSQTEQHPEGMLLSNWFIRRIEDKDTGGMVVGGKTGYVDQSGNCAVSFGTDQEGKTYICVTANADGKWSCIVDHAYLYQYFSEI